MKKNLLLIVMAVNMISNTGLYAQETERTGRKAKKENAVSKQYDLRSAIASNANLFLSAGNGTGGHRALLAGTLTDGKDDPVKADELKDFFLLDIRRPSDFSSGHIEGAVNIQLQDVASAETLKKLPTDKPILVICYTGHTASLATGVLCTIGYDAWTLKFGMMSWSETTSTSVWSPDEKQVIKGGNLPVVK